MEKNAQTKHITKPNLPLIAVALSALVGCDMPNIGMPSPNSLQTIGFAQDAPDGAAPGTCWGKTISPAIIETVRREVLLQPAQVSTDGRIQQPAVYKKEDVQEIVQQREETWYETVCPNLMTDDFVASLQRALSLRGAYRGKVTGLMDDKTRRAISKFQQGGFESGNLTGASARALGFVAIPRPAE
ncbi:peptidoglycan-binding protein [Ascidiaceihabitans sp.]|nr:peptidoglycan-binding protein [Ascidiaceihabitans sp.]